MKTLLLTLALVLSVAGVADAATAPSVSTGSASGLSASGATLNGSVNPNGTATSWYFEYGKNTNYGKKTSVQNAGSGTSSINVSSPVSGLGTGDLYHFRLVATSDGGESRGADQTFTPATVAGPPAATTGSATSISTSSANLRGTVSPNGQSTTWYFEYGTTTSYGSKTSARSAGSGTSSTSVSATASGLTAGTAYHYRLLASSAAGTTVGADQTFTTLAPPAVTTDAAQGVGTTIATLTGSVNPNGRSTTWYFEYGTTTTYGSKTSSQNAGSGTGVTGVSAGVTSLAAGTTYHFRLVASSSRGTTRGADGSFATLAPVTLRAGSLRVVAGRSVSLTGTASGGQAGVTVAILAQPFGASSFSQIATVLSGGGGLWTYLARPTIGVVYQASANGGTSVPVTIGVQPAVSLRVITGARFSTRVVAGSASFAGKIVQLQSQSGGRWVTVKRQRLSTSSTATFGAAALPPGTSTIRIALSVNQAGPGYLGGLSRRITYRRP